MSKNFFTRFYNALSDPKAFYSFEKEMNSKAVEQVFFNSFLGMTSFKAVVLPADVGAPDALNSKANSPKAIRVRPLDVHDFILPEPCDASNAQHRKKIIAMHPVAYPLSNFKNAGGNTEESSPVVTGMVVECTFKHGPQGGQLRGLTYRKTSIVQASLNLECLGDVQGGLREAFGGGGVNPVVVNDGSRLSFGGEHKLEKIEAKIKPSNKLVVGVGAPEVLPQAQAEIAFWADKQESDAGEKGKTDKNSEAYRRVQLYAYYTIQMQNKREGKKYREVSEYFPNYKEDEDVKKKFILAGQDGTTGFMHWSAVSISWVMRGSGFGASSGHVWFTDRISRGKSPGWEARSLLRERVKILVGDVLVKTRKSNGKGISKLEATHSDVVYKVDANFAYLCGGNVDKPNVTGDRGWFGEIRRVAIKDGILTNPGPYIVVLKKMK
jgi:hypothetical protein